jgi:hypothetical protein
MTRPKGYTPEEYAEAYQRLGTHAKVAAEFGVDKSAVGHALKRLKDPAILAAMKTVGTGMVPSVAWIKTKGQDGAPGYSVMLRPGPEDPETVAQRVRDALEGMEPLPEVPAPEYTDSDLCTLLPISDVHIGLQSWGRETGEDYNTEKAKARLIDWVGQCIAASPPSDTCIVLDNGDLTHADDNTNMTPSSKHVLDVDTRHFKTLEVAIEALAYAVELALGRHNRVLVRILPGNHNRESYLCVMFALAERFRDNPRVRVQKVPGEFFVHEFGKVLIAAHHGDKAKADRMVHFLADDYAEMWGRTRHRFLWTGHLHHHKAQDIGGVQWEQLRAVTARDAYAVSHAYTARAQLQAITYHRERGEISRVKVSA